MRGRAGVAVLMMAATPMSPAEPTPDPGWTIIPGERIGPVTPATGEADLIELLGRESVTRDWIYLAEGFCSPGTRVFPGTADELAITWRDEQRSAPATVRISKQGARWTTPDGVRMGTNLNELEEIRGEPIVFGGFGWDYGGGTWWGTPTDEGGGGVITLRLAPTPESARPQGPRAREIYGEGEVRSNHPVVREMTIVVVGISQSWGNPWRDVECPT